MFSIQLREFLLFHVGISELFVKKNVKPSFTMIHKWAGDMMVPPRSVARVEEGGLFLNNCICMKPVGSLQMSPSTHLVKQDAVARFYTIIVDIPGLPPESKVEIDRAIEESDKDTM